MTIETRDSQSKISTLDELAVQVRAEKEGGAKIVHCHGVFDLLHIGHIRHFDEAKKMGDILVVTLTPDHLVNKGPGRPVFTESLRAEAIAALNCVDHVAINKWSTAVETINLLAPDFYVKGSEYSENETDLTGGITQEENAVKSMGGQLAFTHDITFSSSNLINNHMSVYPIEVTEYMQSLTGRYSSDKIVSYLDDCASMKILVLGETIIDEYVYCATMGKSGKEPVLVTRELGSEKMAGGIVAVANHVTAISDFVTMLTFLGQNDGQEDFINEKLNPSVDARYLYLAGGAPTITKRRFVERYPFQKLFELYVMDEGESMQDNSEILQETLLKILPDYDLVMVTDYGHGMISPETVQLLCDKSKFLAVNTQVNAGNLGFNTVSKYPRADFVCVDENEIRLEARSKNRDLREIVLDVSKAMDCEQIIVTMGPEGSLCYTREEGFVQVPAVAMSVVDRIGAGDTVFSVASICAASGTPMEITGFLGNVAGAEAVATVGNRSYLQRVPFIRHVQTLLK